MKSTARIVRMAVAITLLFMPILAKPAETEHREHGAHEHGHGVLGIVIEENDLAIEFEVPAINVVGFEHDPSNEEQRHAVENAIALFKRSEALFLLPETANCRISKTEVAMSREEHHVKEKPSDQKNSAHDIHSELHAEYLYHCNSPEKLKSVNVQLFDHLIGASEIDVQIVTPTRQMATELTPNDTVVKFTSE